MKKKMVLLFMTGCMIFGILFTGCGSMEETRTVSVRADEIEEEDGEEKLEKKNRKEAENEEQKKVEKQDEKERDDNSEEEKEASKSKTPVLGGKNVEDYDGFSYLYEETLMTGSEEDEDTGKMKKEQITVYIPKGDYADTGRDFAYAEKMGLEFDIRLNPYIHYEQEEYSEAENLQEYIGDEYDEFYSTDRKDLEISEVEELTKDSAQVSVKYCEYNSWDEEYDVVYATHFLKKVKPGLMVLVDVKISGSEAEPEIEDLIDEIEVFYEFDIDWDSEEAEEKLEDFLANDNGDTETFSTGFLKFDLPKGWKEDWDGSNASMTLYAPDGDSEFAECGIAVMEEYIGYDMDDASIILADEDFVDLFITSQLGDDVDDVTVEEYGTTCIGKTVLVKCAYRQAGEDIECRFYLSGKGSSLYGIVAIQLADAQEDAFRVAEDILENGKLNE